MEDASVSPPATYSQRARRLAAVAERRRLNVLRAAASPKRSSSPTRGSPSRRPGSPPRFSPKATGGSLAYALQQASCQWDAPRLSAPSLGITSIGAIPDCYTAATALYLGRNALASLEGLQQFPALTTLSLADNQLQQVADLSMLAVACPALVSLAVEGNPLSRLPHARAHVLVQLPQLQQLDGVVVRPRDREAAAAAVQQEESCMALMVSNACVVHKLARAAELLQLHCELRGVMHGRCRALASWAPAPAPLDVLKLLRLWDYEAGLSATERGAIAAALQREVVRVHRQLTVAVQQLGPSGSQLQLLHKWGTAFSQVMLAQQRTITQLLELVTRRHAAAAAELAALQRWPAGDDVANRGQDQQQQEEREALISDLRDTAWELAQHIVSSLPGAPPAAPAAAAPGPSTAAAAAAVETCAACGCCLAAGEDVQADGEQCCCQQASDVGSLQYEEAEQQQQQSWQRSSHAGHGLPSVQAYSEDFEQLEEEEQDAEGELDCTARRLSYSPPTAAAVLAASTGRQHLPAGVAHRPHGSARSSSSHRPQAAGGSGSPVQSRWSLRPHRGSGGARRVARSLQYEAEPSPATCSPGGTRKQPAAGRVSSSSTAAGHPAAAKSPGPARQPATPSPVSPAASSISRVLTSQRAAGRRSITSSPPHLARLAAVGGSSSRRGSPHGSTSSRLGSPGAAPLSPSARQLLRVAALLRCSQEWEAGGSEAAAAAPVQRVDTHACRSPPLATCNMCGGCLEHDMQATSATAAEARRSSGSSSHKQQYWQQQQQQQQQAPGRGSCGGGSVSSSPGRTACPLHFPSQQRRSSSTSNSPCRASAGGRQSHQHVEAGPAPGQQRPCSCWHCQQKRAAAAAAAGRLCSACRLQVASSRAGHSPAAVRVASGSGAVARSSGGGTHRGTCSSGGGARVPDPAVAAQQPGEQMEAIEQLSQQQLPQQQQQQPEEEEVDPAEAALLQLTPLELVQAAEAAAQALFEGAEAVQQQPQQHVLPGQEHQGLLPGWHATGSLEMSPAGAVAPLGATSSTLGSPGANPESQQQLELQQQWALQQQQVAALQQQQAQLLQQLQAASSVGHQGSPGAVGAGLVGVPTASVADNTCSPAQGRLSSGNPFAPSPSPPNTELLQLLGAGYSTANTPAAPPQQSGWQQEQQQGPTSPWQPHMAPQQQQQQQQQQVWPPSPQQQQQQVWPPPPPQQQQQAWPPHQQQQQQQQAWPPQQQQPSGWCVPVPQPYASPSSVSTTAAVASSQGSPPAWVSPQQQQQVPSPHGTPLQRVAPQAAAGAGLMAAMAPPGAGHGAGGGGGPHAVVPLRARGPTLEDWSDLERPAPPAGTPGVQQQQQLAPGCYPVASSPRVRPSSRQGFEEGPAVMPPAAGGSMLSRRSSTGLVLPKMAAVQAEGSELSAALATVAALYSPRASAAGGISVSRSASPQSQAPAASGVAVSNRGPDVPHDSRQISSSSRAPSTPVTGTAALHSPTTVPAPSVPALVPAVAALGDDALCQSPTGSLIAAAAASTLEHVGARQGPTAAVSNASISRQHSFTATSVNHEQQQQQQQAWLQQQQQSLWGLPPSRRSSPGLGGQPCPAALQPRPPLAGLQLEVPSLAATGATLPASPRPQLATSPAAAAAAALAVLADSAAPKAAAAAAAITKMVAAAGSSRPGTPGSLSRPLSRAASVILGGGPAAGAGDHAAAGAATDSHKQQQQQQRSASPLQQLAELQQQLVLMAVDKAGLAKQLQRAEQQCAGLQSEVMQQHLVAEAANTELQARLATAQAQLAQATEAASLQQQDQELLQERLQQVEAAWQQQQEEAARAAAVEALGKVALCHRTLRTLHAAAQQQRAERQQEEAAVAAGRRRALQRALGRWRVRAGQQAGVRGLLCRVAAERQRLALSAWQQYTSARRHKAEATALAQQHLRRQRQRRVLSHWRYAAWHAAQLLDGGSSSGGSRQGGACSDGSASELEGPYSTVTASSRRGNQLPAQHTPSAHRGHSASPQGVASRQRRTSATPARQRPAVQSTPGLFTTPGSTHHAPNSSQQGQLVVAAEGCHVPAHVQREVAARLLAAQQRQRWLVQRGWWGWVAAMQRCWQHQHRAELLLRWRCRRALAAAFCSWRGATHAAPAESALSQRLEQVQEAAAERLQREQQRRRLRACFCAWWTLARGARRKQALADAYLRSRQLLLVARALRALRAAVAHARQQQQLERVAARHEARSLLRRAWGVWAGSVWRRGAEQRAAAMAGQQKVARAVFLWHKASAAVLRRVAAQHRATHLSERITWRTARAALQQWQAAVLTRQRDRAAQAAAAAGQQAASLGEQLAAAQAQLAAVTAAKEEGEAARVLLERQLTEAVESGKVQQEASAKQVQELQQAASSGAAALQQQLADAQQVTQSLQQQLAAASAARDALESELSHAHQQQQALVQQLAAASQQRSNAEASATQQAAAAHAARSQVLQLSGQVKQLSARLTDTSRQLQEANAFVQQQAAGLEMAQGSARDATLALAQQSLEHHQQQAALQQLVEQRGAAAKQLQAQYEALRCHLEHAVAEDGAARDEMVAGLRAQLGQQAAAASGLQQQLEEAARQHLHQQAKAASTARRLKQQLAEVQELAAQQAALLATHTLHHQQQGQGQYQVVPPTAAAAAAYGGAGAGASHAGHEAVAARAGPPGSSSTCSPGAAHSGTGREGSAGTWQHTAMAAAAAAAALGSGPGSQVSPIQQQQQQRSSWLGAAHLAQPLHTTTSSSVSPLPPSEGGQWWGEGAAPGWPSRLPSSAGPPRAWSSSSSAAAAEEGVLRPAFTPHTAAAGGGQGVVQPGGAPRRQQEQLLIITHEDSQLSGLGGLGLAASEGGSSAPSPPATSPVHVMRRWAGPGTSSLPPSPAAGHGVGAGVHLHVGGGRGGSSSRGMWRSVEELGQEERANLQSVTSLIDYAKGLLGGMQ